MAQMTVNELATKLETSPRTTRKFLRSITPKDEQPGKGKRWSIEKRDVRGLVKKFADFQTEHMRGVDDDAVAETE
ncbi:MerR-like helix-turn-helix DNA binding domain protein [Microbacterium phage Huwbert]|nr:MerR-like helix-turn-helix DNA binding domain protein [Microbacterium phage Huwbert]WNO27858.1 MerR-like helix-turn-helix DNA binding domain protein [Microbacterium phage Huwbert]